MRSGTYDFDDSAVVLDIVEISEESDTAQFLQMVIPFWENTERADNSSFREDTMGSDLNRCQCPGCVDLVECVMR